MTSYPLEKQYQVAATRSVEMKEQLVFSIQLDEELPYDKEIFFTAIFTNTTEHPLTIRIPQQTGVVEIEHPITMIFFDVNALDEDVVFSYPLDGQSPQIVCPMVEKDEFVTIDSFESQKIELQLPHIVVANYKEPFPLPPGSYRITMVYINRFIGYEIKKDGESWFVDQNAWVGRIEAAPVYVTISP